jgi:hypothetical protein
VTSCILVDAEVSEEFAATISTLEFMLVIPPDYTPVGSNLRTSYQTLLVRDINIQIIKFCRFLLKMFRLSCGGNLSKYKNYALMNSV